MAGALVVAEVPAPDESAAVAGRGEHVGEQHFRSEGGRGRGLAALRILARRGGEIVGNAVLARNAAGEQRGATGRSGGRAQEVISKSGARGGQAVEVGSLNLEVAVTAEHPRCEVLGDDQHEIGPRGDRSLLSHQGPGQQRRGGRSEKTPSGAVHARSISNHSA